MILWFLCLFINSIESSYFLNPSDLSCKKREYQLITNQSSYIISVDNPSITVHAAIGFDNEHISSLLTELWYEQFNQQFITLQSPWSLFKIDGELNNNSWNLKFSSIINQSSIKSLDLSSYTKSILNIQSTIFNKEINFIIQNDKKNSCSYPKSSIDFGICCDLCSKNNTCPEIKILSEHSRYDMMVTNHGLIVSHPNGEFNCLLFPSEKINRFWSTITNTMNIGQKVDQTDICIVQHSYGIIQNYFYYSLYPFDHWNKQIMNFDFIDILFIPYKQLVIFQLEIFGKLVLHVYEYQLNKTLQLNNELYFPESIIQINSSSLSLYFHMLSNILYLIGKQNIYASNNYGAKFIRIWTDDLLSNEWIILDPVVFSDTGHIAFVYRLNNYYFAVFSKAGLYYGWRTEKFRSSSQMDKPFFFDSTGSFYFNTSPPLLIILATEQSLIPTSNVLVNHIPGPFFVRETDMDRLFVFCSLSKWDYRFELIGSTIRFDNLGLFYIINMDTLSSSFGFCLQTSRLDSISTETSRQCQLKIHFLSGNKNLQLQISNCIFTKQDENSTIIISKFPNIFIEKILNDTFASGRIFQEIISNITQVNQWNIIHLQKVEQILDRCLLKNLNINSHRSSFIYLRPGTIYPLINNNQFITKKIQFLFQNDYKFNDNHQYLITSLFNNRKSIIHQEFIRTQLSCYLPFTRIKIFQTKCLENSRIEIISDSISIEPPINFQLNRYQAGFNSVIVYNLDFNLSICDGYRNCSCISSLISHYSIHCAEQFYMIDSTVDNHVNIKLLIENQMNNKSIFLIEELSKRNDYQIINNLWTKKIQENYRDLFLKNFNQLTDDEIQIFNILNNSSMNERYLFLGPNLNIKLFDEGLYHFRLTYLWGDQYCLTSTDLLILIISNTPTITNYLFNYFLACIFILILLFILWIIFDKKIVVIKKEKFFVGRRIINDNNNKKKNLEVLVQIREQSERLLPYQK